MSYRSFYSKSRGAWHLWHTGAEGTLTLFRSRGYFGVRGCTLPRRFGAQLSLIHMVGSNCLITIYLGVASDLTNACPGSSRQNTLETGNYILAEITVGLGRPQ